MSSILWQILGILALICCSAFFSGSETAYSTVSPLRMQHIAAGGGRADGVALYIAERYDSALISILIGNNLANMASSSVATVLAMSLLGDGGAWVATAVMTVMILTFGEILPKILAANAPYSCARLVAFPLRGVMFVLKPLGSVIVALLKWVSKLWEARLPGGPTVTEDDLETILDTAEDEGILDEDRCDLLQSALDFDNVLAYEVITPRVDLHAIDLDDPWEEILAEALSTSYSRIPVYEDSIDNIVGILHLNRLFKRLTAEGQPAELTREELCALLMPARFVHKTMPLDDVLAAMRRYKQHMVIVTDEYGGTMGCLTMEDVLEQLVGDIWDESDEINEEFVELDATHFEADGDMRIYDFLEEMELDEREFDDDNATLGGWAIEMLGGYPKAGDSFDYKNLTVTVKKLQNMRVTRLGVEVRPLPDEDGEDTEL